MVILIVIPTWQNMQWTYLNMLSNLSKPVNTIATDKCIGIATKNMLGIVDGNIDDFIYNR